VYVRNYEQVQSGPVGPLSRSDGAENYDVCVRQSCSKYYVIKYKHKYKRCKYQYQYQYMKSKYKYKYRMSKYQYKYKKYNRTKLHNLEHFTKILGFTEMHMPQSESQTHSTVST